MNQTRIFNVNNVNIDLAYTGIFHDTFHINTGHYFIENIKCENTHI